MRVVLKFALAFLAASLVCLFVFTQVLAEREAERLRKTSMVGLQSYARALVPVLESTWREHGYGGVQTMVRGFDASGVIHTHVARTGVEAAPALRPAADTQVVAVELPLRGPDGSALLVLQRDLPDGHAILRAERGDELRAAALLALAMSALAVALGALVIGRPLSRIAHQARRIGEGDFSQRLRATGRDEIGALEKELNAMCARLVEARTRLEEESTARVETLERLRHLDRLRIVGTISSGVAHELGTPLNVLILRGRSLAKGELDASEAREAGVTVVGQVEKMSRIVRQLMSYARAEQAATAQPERVDLGEVADTAARLLRPMAHKQGVELRVERRAAVYVHGSFQHLEQAVTNLVVNGIQAMPGGGELTVRVCVASERASLEVIDAGPGMSDEVRSRVFEPFYTTKAGEEGTGLGLHVALGIAQEHDGVIDVQSNVGHGSTFTLSLPRLS